MKRISQTAHRPCDCVGVVGLEQQRLWIRLRTGVAVVLFVERAGGRLEAAAPAVTRVADDAEEPGASISATEGPEVSQRPQGRFLHDVLRIAFVAHQTARQPPGGVKMRQDDGVETFAADRCRGRRAGCHPASVWRAGECDHRQHPYIARTMAVQDV